MKEIVKYGVQRIPKEFVGSETEKEAFSGAVAGDRFYTEGASGMLAAYFWNGATWKVFERYEY